VTGAFTRVELEHWDPSKTVPAAQLWQTPLIKLQPELQAQVAPFQAALVPHEGAEGSHWPEAELRMYPLAQEEVAEHLVPSHEVPAAQGAQASMALWKNPELQVQETPLK
jgi:hypothetical protein